MSWRSANRQTWERIDADCSTPRLRRRTTAKGRSVASTELPKSLMWAMVHVGVDARSASRTKPRECIRLLRLRWTFDKKEAQ
eukprot:1844542-Pleurochrysis_carterae.AAC.1